MRRDEFNARIMGQFRRRVNATHGRNEQPAAVMTESQRTNVDETAHSNSLLVSTKDTINGRPRRIPLRVRSLIKRSPGLFAAGAIGVVLAVAYLLAPPMGRDLSAQMAHAQLAEQHWPDLLDLRWYGGFNPLGYSVLSPPVMALLGVRLTTALGYVASVVLFAALLKRTNVARPVAGAVVGAMCLTGNLVTTRTTFILGLVMGVGALLALVSDRRRVTAVLAVLAALSSPVAGLFLGVCGAAIFLSGQRRSGAALAAWALLPTVAVGLAFGNGGRQPFADNHALIAFVVCLGVAALCWRSPLVRWGALLTGGLIAAAYLLPTPVGTNATRLPELFAAPIIVAVAAVPSVAVVAVTATVVVLLPPVSLDEIRDRGDPALDAGYYAPLLDQLAARDVFAPIEVVPTRRRGEVAAVPRVAPIARGWLRQVDIERNPVFYDGSLDAGTYRRWLDDNAVSHVAISDGPHDWAAPDEAALVRQGLPYLEPVWSDGNWVLYAVTDPRPVISPPGRLVGRDAVSLTVALPEPGEYTVRVRWSQYLSPSEGCMRRSADGWAILRVDHPGTVKIEGSLPPRHC
jgi:hypothetical protein